MTPARYNCYNGSDADDGPLERIAFDMALSSLRANVLEQLLRADVDRVQVVVENTRSSESYEDMVERQLKSLWD